ncbi:anti-sigma factor domain-containing protein [Bacillus solimangrovi]|uniref:RsgI N-terminal anti-sigma domain-containing protein n=1 Tax=Bacillus solimangrovi TaxID=1305675 RepID=A0A1E5LE14_9BACI|nr:anti-sigma factor domain-containing protein [Bacillus solimangrovi]OEH92279.1 hypothetical protein BFG57_03165 [Bacillus solimangrovi]
MKRGIVMDLNNRKAVVLTKDGEFKKVSLKKYPHVTIGDEVVVPESYAFPIYSKSIPVVSATAAAAIFLIILLSSFPLSTGENAVAAFIGLDINPSVEAGINQQLEVIELKALNEDGNKILTKIGSFDDMTLQQLLSTFLTVSKTSGYLDNSKDMLVTTILIDDSGSMEKPIEEVVGSWQEQSVSTAGIAITTMNGNRKQREQARENGLSTGKYLMYLQAKENVPMTIEEVKTLSVEQLNDKLYPVKTLEIKTTPQEEEQESTEEVPAAVESIGQADSSEESVNKTTQTSPEKIDIQVQPIDEGLDSSSIENRDEEEINDSSYENEIEKNENEEKAA